MIRKTALILPRLLLLLVFCNTVTIAETVKLWPNGNPDDWRQSRPEKAVRSGEVTRIHNVNEPTLTYRPPEGPAKDAAIIICPGGGYGILAIDKEGQEIAQWYGKRGYHTFVLKYRLPLKSDKQRYGPALQDAQRAIGIVRSKAEKLKFNKVGIMGFSAGGHLSAATSTNFEKRTYQPQDDIDKLSCRPDFTGLIYPAYLVKDKKTGQLAGELKVDKNTPPTFLVQTSDDGIPVENSLFYYLALKNNKVVTELHIFNKGPHGYGMRTGDKAVGVWPELFHTWLEKEIKVGPSK